MSIETSKMSVWGAIYALLSQYTEISPVAMDNIISLPGEHFGRLYSRALPYMTPSVVKKMEKLVCQLSLDDLKAGATTCIEQSQFWVTFYAEGGISGGTKNKKRLGRPPSAGAIDWSHVDWTETNAVIARKQCCSAETVRLRRQKIEKESQTIF